MELLRLPDRGALAGRAARRGREGPLHAALLPPAPRLQAGQVVEVPQRARLVLVVQEPQPLRVDLAVHQHHLQVGHGRARVKLVRQRVGLAPQGVSAHILDLGKDVFNFLSFCDFLFYSFLSEF